MLIPDSADTEIILPTLERVLSRGSFHAGGIPGRELRRALQTGKGLSVVYQPQVNVGNHEVSVVEALVRWKHPAVGNVSPRVFIPISEETGLIFEVTEFVLQEACRLAKRRPGLTVAVNLSPLLFSNPMLIERFAQTVERCGVRPEQIEFEITENCPLAGNEVVAESIAFLRQCGFRIALDDFGTGYSGPVRLKHIEADKLKIDQSFVRDINRSAASAKAIHAMISLGRRFNLAVTAEGVETVEQRDFLSAAGCDALQGYFFAAPMSSADIEAFLTTREWIFTAA